MATERVPQEGGFETRPSYGAVCQARPSSAGSGRERCRAAARGAMRSGAGRRVCEEPGLASVNCRSPASPHILSDRTGPYPNSACMREEATRMGPIYKIGCRELPKGRSVTIHPALAAARAAGGESCNWISVRRQFALFDHGHAWRRGAQAVKAGRRPPPWAARSGLDGRARWRTLVCDRRPHRVKSCRLPLAGPIRW
jgi:hypothetical protein